jgi:hypothetical protein
MPESLQAGKPGSVDVNIKSPDRFITIIFRQDLLDLLDFSRPV